MTFLVLCRSSSFSRSLFIRCSPSLAGLLEFQTQTRLDPVTITHNQVHDCTGVRQTTFPSVRHPALTIRRSLCYVANITSKGIPYMSQRCLGSVRSTEPLPHTLCEQLRCTVSDFMSHYQIVSTTHIRKSLLHLLTMQSISCSGEND